MSLDWIGWSGLLPNEQLAAIVGAGIGLWLGWQTALRMLAGHLAPRPPAKKKKRKKPAAASNVVPLRRPAKKKARR